MGKDRHTIFRFAASGFAVAVVFMLIQVLADSFTPPKAVSNFLFTVFIVFCPPSLLTVPLIDIETGTSGFYIVWLFVALLNAVLYTVIGSAYVGVRKKRGGEATG